MADDWLERPTLPTKVVGVAAEIEFPGAIDELRRLWLKYRWEPNAKTLVGRDFQDWKQEHGFPYDGDGR